MPSRTLLCFIIVPCLALIFPLTLNASVVGHFTQVTGPVDLLKGGRFPARLAQVQDGVEPGDIIRTKAKGKAQLTMVDYSVITLAPASRLAIADYVYNPRQPERRAVVRLFRGLVHAMVSHLIKGEEPDFIMQTNTAIVGVRGTSWFTAVGPITTGVYLPHGALSVTINVPNPPAPVLLHSMRFIQVPRPFTPQILTAEIIKTLERLMETGLSDSGVGFGMLPTGGGRFQVPTDLPASPDQKILQQTIPPVISPTPQKPAETPAPAVSPSWRYH